MVIDIIKKHIDELLCFTYNKSIQKTCESFRVSPGDKVRLKGMRR